MPKFGGNRRIRKACIDRQCQYKKYKYKRDKKQPLIKTIFKSIKSEENEVSSFKMECVKIEKSMQEEYVEMEETIKSELEANNLGYI